MEPWVVAATGHDGCIRVWDIQDSNFPLICKTLTRGADMCLMRHNSLIYSLLCLGWVLSMLFYDAKQVIFTTEHNVQACDLISSHVTTLASHKAAVWVRFSCALILEQNVFSYLVLCTGNFFGPIPGIIIDG